MKRPSFAKLAALFGLPRARFPRAVAADKLKIGFISTLSGPSAALGVDIRDGFNLAIKLNGGKLGGLPVDLLVGDDQFKPEVGKQLAEKYVRLDKVDILTGIVFSNIMLAAVPEAFNRQGALYQPERSAFAARRQAVQSRGFS